MQLCRISALFALCASVALAQTAVSVSYDEIYQTASESTNYVACSEILQAAGQTTFGQVPDFPYIGGASVVTGFDAPYCSTCWNLTYESNTIHVYVIDSAGDGFNIALDAMNLLTNNQSEFYGRVNATATQVDDSVCGRGQVPTIPH
ncbi:hypothetical protein FOMPIDRAFT_124824 [Fomitopsis schrenkii]|uniref:Cerato-platanin n=1 Tax=Fomitopsis schrenkii TaxID=2126942 RepID=S8FJ42_FOMSC|nr:hypothetical protein FOMPIDRAFT_124824 [Fomitopsis schrenkii]